MNQAMTEMNKIHRWKRIQGEESNMNYGYAPIVIRREFFRTEENMYDVHKSGGVHYTKAAESKLLAYIRSMLRKIM